MEQHNAGDDQVRPRLFGTPVELRRWLRVSLFGKSPLFFRAWAYWLYRYFFRLGFLDGTEGLIFHFLQGCWFRFLVDARIYEERRARKRPSSLVQLADTQKVSAHQPSRRS
jgi:hypothetical protein